MNKANRVVVIRNLNHKSYIVSIGALGPDCVNLVNSRPCKEIDLEAHGILMDQVELLNKLIDDYNL